MSSGFSSLRKAHWPAYLHRPILIVNMLDKGEQDIVSAGPTCLSAESHARRGRVSIDRPGECCAAQNPSHKWGLVLAQVSKTPCLIDFRRNQGDAQSSSALRWDSLTLNLTWKLKKLCCDICRRNIYPSSRTHISYKKAHSSREAWRCNCFYLRL